MVTTTTENLLQKLASRDQWNLKDMTKKPKKDAWMLRTQLAFHKAGVVKALEHGRPTVASIKALHPKLGVRTLQSMVDSLLPGYRRLRRARRLPGYG
jgi:hypothetical protein